MQTRYTLAQASELATDDVASARQYAELEFGAGLFDRAMAHHEARNLRATLGAGETRDSGGIIARYVGGHTCQAAHVWFDFFRGHVMNSVSRMARGLSA